MSLTVQLHQIFDNREGVVRVEAIKIGQAVSVIETKATIKHVIEILKVEDGSEKVDEASNILESLLDDLSYEGRK